jgi:fructosamine-3-kinase
MFSAEAHGLKLLAATKTLKVPEVICQAEAGDGVPAFLVLEWLPTGASKYQTETGEQLGEGLAALHRHSAEAHGLDQDNFIGQLPQPNTPQKSWVAFYRDHRIGFQQEIARRQGYLPAERERLLDRLMEKLPELLPDAAPSLLHGDLWGGNYAVLEGGKPVIYDPAVYYGHREVEIAFTELFGGFAPSFYGAYNATFLIEPEYEERRALYQLYPLMVHLNLFGDHYGAQVDAIARYYAG